jgi:hypothetical protein
MTMRRDDLPLLMDVLSQPGVYRLVGEMYKVANTIQPSIYEQMCQSAGVSQRVSQDLFDEGVLYKTPGTVRITPFGQRVTLLLKAINGDEDLSVLIQKLGHLYPQLKPYDLITSSVTDYVLDIFGIRRDFIRLYLCSPWIRLEQRQWDKLRAAVWGAREKYTDVQVLVITQPEKGYRDKKAWIQTTRELTRLGAQIVVNDKLHAKLYISEPGPLGGTHYAVFGSENLTGAGNVELAFKVENDNEILTKLTAYFTDIQFKSQLP